MDCSNRNSGFGRSYLVDCSCMVMCSPCKDSLCFGSYCSCIDDLYYMWVVGFDTCLVAAAVDKNTMCMADLHLK